MFIAKIKNCAILAPIYNYGGTEMKKKGFTLMELLIVVAVITIMIAIALPTFSAQKRKAAENADIENVSALWTEMQANYEIYGTEDSQDVSEVMRADYNDGNNNAKDVKALIGNSGGWKAGNTVTISNDKDGKFSISYK